MPDYPAMSEQRASADDCGPIVSVPPSAQGSSVDFPVALGQSSAHGLASYGLRYGLVG